MLGSDVMACLHANQINAAGYDLPETDITNQRHLEDIVSSSSLVINCAAYTNVDRAESEEALAIRINGDSVGSLGRLAANMDIPVIHISTDFVFDGMLDRPYLETDPPNPINAYGRSKLEGEKQLAGSGCRFCLIRVEWTYGAAGINFVKKIVEAARVRPVLRVVDDQVGSPTSTREAAEVICQIVRKDVFPEGVYHLAAEGYASRYATARFLCQIKKVEIQIEPCKTADFPSPAKRPLNSRFACQKLESLMGFKMRPWQEPLQEFLEKI